MHEFTPLNEINVLFDLSVRFVYISFHEPIHSTFLPSVQAELNRWTADKIYLIDTSCLYSLAYFFIFVVKIFEFFKFSLDKILCKWLISIDLQR